MSSSNFITCLIDFNIPMWVLWFLLTFLSIGHTALWIVFLSTSDQFNFDIWLYNLCNFIILSMRNKLDWEKHIGRRKHIIRYFVHLFISFVVCPFVLFLLVIVFSVLLRYTDSDYPFGIFKHFLYKHHNYHTYSSKQY